MRPLSFGLIFIVFGLLWSPLQAQDAPPIRDVSELNLSDYHGKVVYLDFWASWCKPCQKSFPWMNGLVNKYPADKFVVVTVNLDSDSADMERFLAQLPAKFAVFHDAKGTLAERFQLPGMPTSFLIDAKGQVKHRHIGWFRNKIPEYEAEIDALL